MGQRNGGSEDEKLRTEISMNARLDGPTRKISRWREQKGNRVNQRRRFPRLLRPDVGAIR